MLHGCRGYAGGAHAGNPTAVLTHGSPWGRNATPQTGTSQPAPLVDCAAGAATTLASTPAVKPASRRTEAVLNDDAEQQSTVKVAFYSPADLHVRWGLSRSMVYKVIRSDGFPPAVNFGAVLRYSRAAVHEWEANAGTGSADSVTNQPAV